LIKATEKNVGPSTRLPTALRLLDGTTEEPGTSPFPGSFI
jgi:hypothetical protein